MKFVLIDPLNKMTITFPITPNELNVTLGTKTINYSHVSIGNSEMPRGSLPATIEFSGMLQTPQIAVPRLESDITAKSLIDQIKSWQSVDKKKLKLIITSTPWNIDVFIDDFKVGYQGFIITFSITLKEYKNIVVKQSSNKKASKKRPVNKPKPKTYTVKKNDTLWGISRKYAGNGIKWPEMWTINKSKSRSKNPDLIYPGEVFTLPSGW